MEDRYATRFTWDAVEPELIRTLLDGFYRAHGDPAAKEPLRQADPERLRVLAASVLGSPLAMRHIDAVIDVLRRDWLPRLDASRLAELVDDVQLALTGPAHDARPRNKPERVRFLQQRHKTHNLKVRVRNAFVAAHKQKLPVQTSTTAVPRDTRPWTLAGEGRADRQVPYPHQELAWTNLDRMFRSRRTQERCGLLVLPTGSGKTYTMVRWLLNQMEDDDHLPVLWIADRQELVEQAALSFVKVARSMPLGFERTLRRIHSAASGPTSLADQDLDVAIATRQSVRGQFNGAAKKRIRRFFGDRPAVVVVDEVHHAVAPTYQDLLDFLQQVADPVLVGLTATPWPSGFEAGKRLRNRSPRLLLPPPSVI